MKNTLTSFLTILTCFLISSSGYAANFDTSRVNWTRLDYEAWVLFFPVSAEVNFSSINPEDAATALISPKFDNPPKEDDSLWPKTVAPEDTVKKISLSSTIMNRKSTLNAWLLPDLTALQRTQIDSGSKKRVKTYRFLNNGVYGQQRTPAESEQDLPLEKWSQFSNNTVAYPQDLNPQLVITEPTSLIFLLTTADWQKPGDQIQVYTLGEGGSLHLVTVKAEEKTQIEVDYKNKQHGKESSIEKQTDVLRLSLQAKPVGNNEAFEFLGMTGTLDIFIDMQQNLLLQLSGELDYVGRVDIKLVRVEQ